MTGISRIVNEDMFGRYCRIPTGASGNMHVYKIVSRIHSNSYCDVPLMVQSKETLHNHLVPVLLVIHCGIDESKVQRVALSDCEIIPFANVAEVKRGKWRISDLTPYCSECGRPSEYECDGTHSKSLFCPNCGARMDGEGE